MMRRIYILLILALSLGIFGFTQPVAAKDILNTPSGKSSTICSGSGSGSPTDPNSSAICTDRTGDNPLTGKDGLLVKITKIISYIAGVSAVIIITISGIRFVTSGGDPEKAATARRTLIGAMIGIVIIVLARVLIVFLLTKL